MRSAQALLAAAVCLAGAGCGEGEVQEPDLGRVTGRITLDGQPAAGVQVIFLPQAASGESTKNVGGISTAMTDADGRYVLTYKEGLEGAAIGTHTVRIMRPEGFEPNPDGSAPPPAGPPIPAKYGVESELQKEVKAGENEINFDLTSR